MSTAAPALPVIVVPEGLGRDRRSGAAVAAPSFVFRAVLEHVAQHHSERRILIAPGNRFGAAVPEHEVARAWLLEHGCRSVETVADTPAGYIDTGYIDTGYIDTWGNAAVLRA
ncbi:MAG TPA: hypothetical protein VFE11_20130, partial [Dongiaceae bacterium]|nr:hypothetical protein [Dongiaceae bacterium]